MTSTHWLEEEGAGDLAVLEPPAGMPIAMGDDDDLDADERYFEGDDDLDDDDDYEDTFDEFADDDELEGGDDSDDGDTDDDEL